MNQTGNPVHHNRCEDIHRFGGYRYHNVCITEGFCRFDGEFLALGQIATINFA